MVRVESQLDTGGGKRVVQQAGRRPRPEEHEAPIIGVGIGVDTFEPVVWGQVLKRRRTHSEFQALSTIIIDATLRVFRPSAWD